jgi:hypothetical protein
VDQFSDLNEKKIQDILKTYSHADLWTNSILTEISNYVRWKKYCIIVHLKNPCAVKPFEINKTGYGIMSAWICIDDIEKIRI